MSKMIEVSDQDYARIQHAADADGMPLGAWVVANLPLEKNGAEPPVASPCTNRRPDRTVADMLGGAMPRGSNVPARAQARFHRPGPVVGSRGRQGHRRRYSGCVAGMIVGTAVLF